MDEKDLVKLSIICIIIGIFGLLFFSLKNQSDKKTEIESINGTVVDARNNRFYTTINITYCTTKKIAVEKKDRNFTKSLNGKNITVGLIKTENNKKPGNNEKQDFLFAKNLIVN